MHHCHKKEIIKTDKAPKALGPYSVAVRSGHFIFTSGQVALVPETNEIAEGGIEAQTRQVFKNLQAVLEEAESSLDKVVKTTVFLQNMNDFAAMNAVYGQFLVGDYPARSTVEVGKLPKGALVEIEAIAVVPCEDHND